MALNAGSVTVNPDDGTHTGSGLALALYNGRKALLDSIFDALDDPPAARSRVPMYQQQAAFANTDASSIVSHITANAVVAVTIPTTSGGAGLQRTPNPNNPNTDTLAPSATKTLNGTIT